MLSSDWQSRIEDILESIARIERYTRGMTLETFVATDYMVDAVSFHFVIIGEAARHIPPEVEARYPSVPWHRMRGMRNVLVHDYRRIDNRVMWNTITDHLPLLTPLLREILEREP